jgi:hypothetical protein
MHLMRCDEAAAGADFLSRRSSQGAHISGITRAAKAELMRPAAAAEKAMWDAIEQPRAFDLEARHLSLPASG